MRKRYFTSSERNRILSQFTELGAICIEPKVGDRVDIPRCKLALRRDGITCTLESYEDCIEFCIKRKMGFRSMTERIDAGINVDGIEFLEKPDEKVRCRYRINIPHETISDDSIRDIYEKYENILRRLQTIGWYKERIDPNRP